MGIRTLTGWNGSGPRRGLRARLVVLAPLALGAGLSAQPSRAQDLLPRPGRAGLVVGMEGSFGGDEIARFDYTDGTTGSLRAGQGLTFEAGAHYRPPSLPLDFTATFGYKFETTRDRDSSLGIDRYVLKVTATYLMPRGFWVDAGPVVHLSPKLDGGGYFDDVKFDDATGYTLGVGFWFAGISYTSMTYKSPYTVDVDASSIDLTLVYKF